MKVILDARELGLLMSNLYFLSGSVNANLVNRVMGEHKGILFVQPALADAFRKSTYRTPENRTAIEIGNISAEELCE
jgi:hypothetical protein